MPVSTRSTLKNWFKKGLKPLEAHFASWIDSFWHLDDSIPISSINGLSDSLNSKASTASVEAVNNAAEKIANKAVAGGYASLDGVGKVPSSQLPSYVDDVLEFEDFASFPVEGETGIIYVDLDTNQSYRWSGSIYVLITSIPSDAGEAIKGISEEATDAETAAGTAVGGTGSKLFVTPAKLLTWVATRYGTEAEAQEVVTIANPATLSETKFLNLKQLRAMLDELAAASEYIASAGDITFDANRSHGFDLALSGDLNFDFTDAKDNVLVKVLHNDTEENDETGLGAATIIRSGEYIGGVDNLIYYSVNKDSGGDVVSVNKTIIPQE
jgi:hypothetical protein